MSVLEAMAAMEGWGVPNARPTRNNNPLDLTYCPECIGFGALRGDPRFAIFPDAETGWNAARKWLSVPAKFDAEGNLVAGYMGATLKQVINRFAPPIENDTDNYLTYVNEETGTLPDTVLTPKILG